MSQAELATAAGIVRSTVQRAEAGQPVSGESARALCSVLGLDASGLAWGTAVDAGLVVAEVDPAGADTLLGETPGPEGDPPGGTPGDVHPFLARVSRRWDATVRPWLAFAAAVVLAGLAVPCAMAVDRWIASSEAFDMAMARALDDPPVPDADVARWATDAVPRIGHVSFVDLDRHLDDVRYLFTGPGLDGYAKALEESGNVRATRDNLLVSSLVPVPALATAVPDAAETRRARTWSVTVPSDMVTDASNRTDKLPVDVRLHVVQVQGSRLLVERMFVDDRRR